MIIELSKSNRKTKKFKVVIKKNDKTKTVHFGQKGYEDYTTHKDKKRMDRYIARNRTRQERFWNKKGIDTASFWARFLLWSKPSITQAIKHIEDKFNVNIIYRR